MSGRSASMSQGTLATILLGPFKLAFAVTLGLALLLIVAWALDWYFVSHVWPTGLVQLHALLEAELAMGRALAAMQGADPAPSVWLANGLYGVVFEASGIHAMALRFADGSPLSIPDTVVRGAFVAHREFMESAMVGTQLVGVRLATLLRFAPLLLLLIAVGAADGLAERAIRRACGGRESASLYHRAKYAQLTLLALGGLTLVLWPGSIAWQVCLGVAAVAACVLVRQQVMYYKKYL